MIILDRQISSLINKNQKRMKRKLFLMSLMLMSVLGMSAQKSWNFSDAQWYSGVDENDKVIATDYTELTTIDGLTLAAPADKKITVDSHKKKVNNRPSFFIEKGL